MNNEVPNKLVPDLKTQAALEWSQTNNSCITDWEEGF